MCKLFSHSVRWLTEILIITAPMREFMAHIYSLSKVVYADALQIYTNKKMKRDFYFLSTIVCVHFPKHSVNINEWYRWPVIVPHNMHRKADKCSKFYIILNCIPYTLVYVINIKATILWNMHVYLWWIHSFIMRQNCECIYWINPAILLVYIHSFKLEQWIWTTEIGKWVHT